MPVIIKVFLSNYQTAMILGISSVLLILIAILLFYHNLKLKKQLETTKTSAEKDINRLENELEERIKERTESLQLKYRSVKLSESQFREAFETAMQGMALISSDGTFIKVNTAACDMLGYKEEELLKTDLQCITHPDDFTMDQLYMQQLKSGTSQSYQLEKRLYHLEGLTAWVLQSMKAVRNQDGKTVHFVAQFIDITERKQAEEQLKKYSETLTVLLREVNHRVKNNLAALISMLHMEQSKAANMKKKEYINFLNDLISRIQSLSTVHSMLSAQNWQPLEIEKLCNQVIRAAMQGTPPTKTVHMSINSAQVKINSNQAHHLALVLNELTTNSVKHALHGRDYGNIHLDIINDNNVITMRYKDDGPGFPDQIVEGDFSMANIGFELIRGIVRQSLDGELQLENDQGAIAIIKFQNELE